MNGGLLSRWAGNSRLSFEALATVEAPPFDLGRVSRLQDARPGDEQVFVAATPGQPDEVAELASLASLTSVRSVVASAEVHSSISLDHLRELLLVGPVPPRLPDPETLANLPGLESLWAVRARSGRHLGVDNLPSSLTSLGVARHLLKSPGKSGPAELLAPLSSLQQLVLRDCLPADSVSPLATMARLRRLWSDAPRGWDDLSNLKDLEDVTAENPRLTDLQPFGGWRRLSRLWLSEGSLASLDGVQGLPHLRQLSLRFLAIDDLAPLAALEELEVLHLRCLAGVHDIEALATLPALRELRIDGAYEARYRMNVASLAPLGASKSIERLALTYTTVQDADLSALAHLPRLTHLEVPRSLAEQAAQFQSVRPNLEIVTHRGPT